MNEKIISIEEIFDWCLKTIEIETDRKKIERYLKDKNQKLQQDNPILNYLIEKLLKPFEIDYEKKKELKNILENYIEIYKCFTQFIEPYNTSQKQLNFLLAKDIIIPFFALFSFLIFDRYISILEQIKPDEKDKSFQKLLMWSEKNICPYPYTDIKKFLIDKHTNDEYTLDKLSERTIKNWLSLKEQTTPSKKHLNRIVRYLRDCNRGVHLNLYNLMLFSKLLQEIHKKLEKMFNKEEVLLLIEHFYLLLSFHSKKINSYNIEETRYKIYDELLKHINPSIINRDFYFDDYFAWTEKLVDRDYLTPYKLMKRIFEKNELYYHLKKENCMKFIEVSLPVLYFNKSKTQNKYVDIKNELYSKKKNFTEYIQKENITLQQKLFFIFLDIKNKKTLNDKKQCNEIFKRLKNEFKEKDTNPYICFLKTRYYIFDDNVDEALKYCEKCVDLRNGKIGEHFKEAVMTGILLSAKTNSKVKYNHFRKLAIKYDSLFFGRLKVPAYGRGGALIDIPEDKSNFEELKEQFDKYFSNKFQ